VETRGNPAVAETATYSYDAADRLTAVVYPEKRTVYTLDGVGDRLTERATSTAGGALTDLTSTYNTRHQLTTIVDGLNASNSVAYTYDANGNQLSRTVGGTGGVTTAFTFDVRDQLAMVRQGASLLGAYGYDSRGLRVVKQGSLGYVHYTYDDHSVLYETDAFGAALAKFDYGSDRLLSLTPGSGGRQFYLFDGLGSVTDLTNLDGSLRATYQYDAWGNPRSTSGQSFNLFGFTGHERDPETGLYYFKARFYDPAVGRFLPEDPFPGVPDLPPSLHRYVYAFGSPAVYLDPSGQCVLGLPCPEWARQEINEQVDKIKATGEAFVKTGAQLVTGLAKGAVKTADLVSFGAISSGARRVGTFLGTEGSLKKRAEAANEEGERAQLSTVTLGFSDAKDKAAYGRELVRATFAADRFEKGSQLVADGLVNGDEESLQRGGAELLGGVSQVTLVVAGAGQAAEAGLARLGEGNATVLAPKATITAESAEGAGVEGRTAGLSRPTEKQLALHQQISLRGYLEQVEQLDVNSPPNTATFWSGPGNRARAEVFARDTGRTTLEMTSGGRVLENEALFKRLPGDMAIQPWGRLSERFTAAASGEVNLFVSGARPMSVYRTIEAPGLQANPDVYKYIYRGY
jgi:RHS repeat-associated protein